MTAAPSLAPDPRFVLLHGDTATGDFAADVRRGLTAERKWLAPRWFYDELGSALFDTICFLPEYYVMRAEAEVLASHVGEIVDALGPHVRLIELGSGTARKTRILLDAITGRQRELEYVPVDVDAAMLERASRDLLADYPGLRISAICSDFARPSLALTKLPRVRGRAVVLFLGSTIGNLEPAEATAMLRDLRSALRPGDAFLLGADLRKDLAILEPAYDDALGVTAAFNRNVLRVVNRELGARFDVAAFAHRALFDAGESRIEMRLVARDEQRVQLGRHGERVFRAGETILTEYSYKYGADDFTALLHDAGFRRLQHWSDADRWFHVFVAAP
jgi:L-histidine N-alpha-methyltransferase